MYYYYLPSNVSSHMKKHFKLHSFVYMTTNAQLYCNKSTCLKLNKLPPGITHRYPHHNNVLVRVIKNTVHVLWSPLSQCCFSDQ